MLLGKNSMHATQNCILSAIKFPVNTFSDVKIILTITSHLAVNSQNYLVAQI